jgi:WD40 repeat protein
MSNHEGYDSQPSFSSDSKLILYTSERDSGQTEIYQYDIKERAARRLTNTPVSEYSPTFAPDGKNISAVVVEPDSTQRLWLYDKNSMKSQVMIPEVKQIGYHRWANEHTLFLFLLTEPFSLVKCDVKSGSCTTVAQHIGRCTDAQRNMKFECVYYTVKDSSGQATIHAYDVLTGGEARYFNPIACIKDSEDFARYGRTFFMASGSKMYYWDMSSRNNKWIEFADLSSQGLKSITRIAISPDGKHIAVVDNSTAQ